MCEIFYGCFYSGSESKLDEVRSMNISIFSYESSVKLLHSIKMSVLVCDVITVSQKCLSIRTNFMLSFFCFCILITQAYLPNVVDSLCHDVRPRPARHDSSGDQRQVDVTAAVEKCVQEMGIVVNVCSGDKKTIAL